MNTLIKDLIKWQKKPSRRREDGVFITEGIKMCRELPAERIIKVVASESFAKANPADIAWFRKQTAGKKDGVIIVSDTDFQKASDTVTPQGIMAVAKAFSYDADELIAEENGLFILLEDLQDPGNLGTILRSSEAAGVSAVIMNETCVDIYNPKVIRATMGSFFRMKFAVVPDLKETVRKISESGGACYAAHLKGTDSYDHADYTGKTAFLIGNESKGLTDELADAADRYIKIPMYGQVESLNAAMAATILMFEAARQRR